VAIPERVEDDEVQRKGIAGVFAPVRVAAQRVSFCVKCITTVYIVACQPTPEYQRERP